LGYAANLRERKTSGLTTRFLKVAASRVRLLAKPNPWHGPVANILEKVKLDSNAGLDKQADVALA